MSGENIRVVGRCRPFSEKEKLAGHTRISNINSSNNSITLTNPKSPFGAKTFSLDAVFDEDSTQKSLYDNTASSIVDAALNGFNGTVFVYGQTGTGKTWTMQGVPDDIERCGIIPTCFDHIFKHISHCDQKKFLVRVSFLEIYNEEIKDLLVKQGGNPIGGLKLKESAGDGIFVKNLSTIVVKSVQDLQKIMSLGNSNRSVGSTLMNENSSRSHSIFTITIESSSIDSSGVDKFVSGKLNLVDLAGSERQSKSGATGDRLKEATKINLSLSALGNCISALVDGKCTHIPYRDSKLTRLLQDSLGGNAKTLMIATLSPANYNFEETMSTLRYASRAKSIKNKPVVNEDAKDMMLKEYQVEIRRLRFALDERQAKTLTNFTEQDSSLHDLSKLDESVSESALERKMDDKKISNLQKKIATEKSLLIASKNQVVANKERMAAELYRHEQDLDIERLDCQDLALKLKDLEARLIFGGIHIHDVVIDQERELIDFEARLMIGQRKNILLVDKLENKTESQLNLEKMKDAVDGKNKKLKVLMKKSRKVSEEIKDIKDAFTEERERTLQTIRELTKTLELKILITENFIPKQEADEINSRAVFDETLNDWIISKKQFSKLTILRPSSITGSKVSVCRYAKEKLASGDTNPRYRSDNILRPKLENYEPINLEFAAPRHSAPQASIFQDAINAAMSEDNEDIFITKNMMRNFSHAM